MVKPLAPAPWWAGRRFEPLIWMLASRRVWAARLMAKPTANPRTRAGMRFREKNIPTILRAGGRAGKPSEGAGAGCLTSLVARSSVAPARAFRSRDNEKILEQLPPRAAGLGGARLGRPGARRTSPTG